MGLKEKQALANLDFGWAERRITQSTGIETKITVRPESFADDLDAVFMVDRQGAVYVANAIEKICDNDIGKEAFNEKKISSVLLINEKDKGSKKVTVASGVLELRGAWGAASDYFSESEIQEEIENQL